MDFGGGSIKGEDINLNGMDNLNPQLPVKYQPLPKDEYVTPEAFKKNIEKALNPNPKMVEKQIENWNNKPEVKEKGIKAEKRWKWNFWQTMGIIGIICLIVITIVGGLYGYMFYKSDGKLTTFICSPNVTLSNSCPPVSCSNVTCGSCNCPTIPQTIVNVKCNSTG